MIDTLNTLNNPNASTDVDFLFDADLHAVSPGLRAVVKVERLQEAYLAALMAAVRRVDPELTYAHRATYAGGGIL